MNNIVAAHLGALDDDGHDEGHRPKGRRTLGGTTFGAENDHARPAEGGVIMNPDDRWSIEVFVGEIDGETDAEVRMTKIDNRNFSGRGKAKLNPADRNVSVIGEEIAIARALSDLSHKLLHSATVGVESMTHEKARLHR